MPPPVGPDATIVLNPARGRPRRDARERVAALAATHQSLHQARLDRAAAGVHLVLVQQLLRPREGRLVDDRRYRDLDPLLARPFARRTVATRNGAAHPQRPRYALLAGHSPDYPRLPEAGRAAIGRVAQHLPHRRGPPAGPGLARGHALLVEPPADRLDAPARDGVVLVDVAHDARFGLDDDVRGRCIVSLPKITVAIRGAAHDADLARSRAVPFPPPRPFEDLGAFVLGDHALKLHQQLILGGGARRSIEEARLDPVTSELFDQQHLVGVFAAQPIRAVNQHDLDVAAGRQVTDPLQSRSFERRSAIPVVFEDPVPGHLEIERRRPLDQCRRLTRDRVRFALPLRGHARVNRRHLHVGAPFRGWQPDACGPAPATRRRGRACRREVDRTRSRDAPAGEFPGVVVHPRR